MKFAIRNYKYFDIWVFQLNADITLRIIFYSLKSARFHVSMKELFSFWHEAFKGNQIFLFESPFIYVELITPRFLLWVNDQKLIDFALSILKNRLHELEDNTAYYLLGKSDATINHDELAELNVLSQVLNFYGVNKND